VTEPTELRTLTDRGIRLYSTCPQSKDFGASDYAEAVTTVARWSEAAGCTGMLVYTDNGIVDPWTVASWVMQGTHRLAPLVAVQPIYMHPYAVAKAISSLAFLRGRPVHLNMLAGGFRNDLLALGDETPHDDRYLRTVEYTKIVRALIEESGPTTFEGRYYTVRNLGLTPPVPETLRPEFLISGSSDAGMQAAEAIEATAVRYPRPPGEEDDVNRVPVPCGVRVGIIARTHSADAWEVALERFPEDRRGQLTHQLSMKVSDSQWHRQLADTAARQNESDAPQGTYWLRPFENYNTFCPYLVGSYEEVAAQLSRYMDSGYAAFILDIPRSADDLEHAARSFDVALEARAA
jgi:alkanesulfonate monooxygenase